MTDRRRALITGITGQDGSYLAELLIAKGYDVYGVIRRASTFNTHRIDHLYQDAHDPGVRLRLVHGDMTDGASIAKAVNDVVPHEVYHLAAQSHVRVSFDIPEYTSDIDALGTLRLLEALREQKRRGEVEPRLYNAASSEMFGNAAERPQSETTRLEPRSPYACAKVFAYHLVRNYREAYGLFATNGILFNHESPRRGETFVTRKVTRAAARIALGHDEKLFLGNLDAKRDWGFAGDYVDGMWRMLQHHEPDDFVLATGETHSVRELLDVAFQHVGKKWEEHVEIDERYFRPTEVDELIGDARKAKKALGWKPVTSFVQLVKMMVDADLASGRSAFETNTPALRMEKPEKK